MIFQEAVDLALEAQAVGHWRHTPITDPGGSLRPVAEEMLRASSTKLYAHWLDQLKEELLGQQAQAVVVDFLNDWRFCPVSQASDPARSCLDDAAKQLLDALKAIPIEGEERS